MAGKDKGKTGAITRIFPKKDRVIVGGVNLYKKHRKATQNSEGGIVSLERSLPTASIMLSEKGKPVRVALKRTSKGVTRISKKSGETV